jgi:hypothetical protein
LKNKRGYSFPMVLMIVTIISLLGVSILSLSMANLKLQLADTKEKQNFYLAEAGLDEAYVLIKQKIKSVIDQSKSDAQASINNTITMELSQDPEDPAASYFLTFRDGSINEENVKTALSTIFRSRYKEYINAQMLSYLNNNGNYKGITADTAIAFTQDDTSWNYTPDTDGINTYKLRAVSRINNTNTEVTSLLKITVPDYEINYTDDTIPVDVKENILWLRPLTAEGKIITAGNGEVQINGDVYAYGGADITSKITVDGSFYSAGDIEKKTAASDTAFTLKNGNLYCSSLKLDSSITNSGKNIVDITGNVFTRDDIELNSEKSNVTIKGSYYGFSDGTSITEDKTAIIDNIDHSPDYSSCILANASDIGETNGSFLTITGQDYDKDNSIDQNSPIKMGNMGLNSGIVIAGTAYVDAVNPLTGEKYQTGESVSIKGNYRSYLQPLWGLKRVGEIDYSIYNASNINFDPFGNMRIANSFQIFGSTTNYKMLPIHRSTYFKLVNSDRVRINGINIDADKILHTAGAYIGIRNSNIVIDNDTTGNADIYSEVPKDFLFYTNKLGDPLYEFNKEGKTNYDYRRDRKDLGKRDFIEDRYNFNQYTSSKTDTDEITYISDSNSVFSIGEPGKTTNMRGIVITKGDIHIRGNVNFTGILVTEGNIYFDDDGGVKNIYYNKRYLLNKIAKNNDLRNGFIYYGNEKIDSTIVNPDINVIGDAQPNTALDKLITFSDWNKTRAVK